jgi:GTPase SAR1 family protein
LLLLASPSFTQTSLLLRFTEPTYDPKEAPSVTGVDNKTFDITIDGRDLRLQIWDTVSHTHARNPSRSQPPSARSRGKIFLEIKKHSNSKRHPRTRTQAGQEKFRVITSTFYKGAHGVLAVYDVTSRESFETISSWMGEVSRYCQGKVARVIVGNKTDLEAERAVSKEEGEKLAGSLGSYTHLESSVFDKPSVDRVFMQLARLAAEEADAAAAAAAEKAKQRAGGGGSSGQLKPGALFKIDDPAAPASAGKSPTSESKTGCKCTIV